MRALTFTLCMLFFSMAAEGADRVLLLTHDHQKPYSYLDPNGEVAGSATDVVRCVFGKMGRKLEVKVRPWKRAQRNVSDGMADGFFAASKNAKRDTYAEASIPIADQNWTWYLLKANASDPFSPQFKREASVSSLLGANMHTWLKNEGYNAYPTPPHNSERLLLMLMTKRFDAALANDQVMGKVLDRLNAWPLVRTVVYQDKPLSVYFSKTFLARNAGFLQEFNQFVLECR